jgi:hypothetical protein
MEPVPFDKGESHFIPHILLIQFLPGEEDVAGLMGIDVHGGFSVSSWKPDQIDQLRLLVDQINQVVRAEEAWVPFSFPRGEILGGIEEGDPRYAALLEQFWRTGSA